MDLSADNKRITRLSAGLFFFFKLYALQKCETMKKKVPFNINPLEAKTAE